MLYQLMYSSIATGEFTDEASRALLNVSRSANGAHGISGLLIYFAPTHEFFQVLEGEKDEVLRLMQNIEHDSRHSQVTIEFEGPIAARSFGEWSMGFLLNEYPKQDSLPGFVDVLHNGMASAHLTEARTPALVLMRATQTMLTAQLGATV